MSSASNNKKQKFPWKDENQTSAVGSSDAPKKFPWKNEQEEEKKIKEFPWQNDSSTSKQESARNKKFPWKEDSDGQPADPPSNQKVPTKSSVPQNNDSSGAPLHQSSRNKDEQHEHVTFQATSTTVDEGSFKGGTHNNDGTSGVFSQSAVSSWAPRQASESASASVGSLPSLHQNQNRPRGTGKSKKQRISRNRRNKDQNSNTKHPEPSLTERIGTSALASTLGILKLAGGVTLSTTGTILSPSLEITRNVVLPSLLTGIADYLSYISPQRLKDWFRIVSASIHHVITVIVSTQQGSVFRHKVVRVGGDLVDVISSDQSQQAQMDGVACFLKFSEALQ